MKRASAMGLAALLLVGCQDVGLDGNVPLEEAEHRPPPALVAAVHKRPAETGGVVLDGRVWVPWGLPQALDRADLRPVGSYQGETMFVRRWDRSPFDALFAQTVTGEWQEQAPVIGYSRGAGH